MIRFACPHCAATYDVPEFQAGKQVQCKSCLAKFTIPLLVTPLPEVDLGLVAIQPCPTCKTCSQVKRQDLGIEVECPNCLTRFLAVEVEPITLMNFADEAQDAAPAPKPRRRWDDREDEEDDRPRRRKRRRAEDDDDDDDDDDGDRRRRPSNVQVIGALLLTGGIYGLVQCLIVGLNTLCLWPGIYFSLVWAIFAIIRSTNILQNTDRGAAPTALVILQILLIFNCDIINVVLGIVNLVMLNDEKVRQYYAYRVDYRD